MATLRKKLLASIQTADSKEDPYADVGKRNPDIPDDFTIDYKGTTIFIRVCPYVWMYPWKGAKKTGVSVALKRDAAGIESELVEWNTPYLKCTKKEVIEKVTEFLKGGGVQKLSDAMTDWAKHHSEYLKAREADKKKEKAEDSKAFADGFRYKVMAVVHHEEGDSDFTIFWYSVLKPTDASIKKELRRQRSIDLTDFKIIDLAA